MSKIVYTQYFQNISKRLMKKDPGLSKRVENALLYFQKRLAIYLGNQLFKVRLAGWHRGKSGGYRLYIYFIEIQNLITPVYIHSKQEKDNISPEELMMHVVNVERELRALFL